MKGYKTPAYPTHFGYPSIVGHMDEHCKDWTAEALAKRGEGKSQCTKECKERGCMYQVKNPHDARQLQQFMRGEEPGPVRPVRGHPSGDGALGAHRQAPAGDGPDGATPGGGRDGRRHERRPRAGEEQRGLRDGHHGHVGGEGRVGHRADGRQLRVDREGRDVGPQRLRLHPQVLAVPADRVLSCALRRWRSSPRCMHGGVAADRRAGAVGEPERWTRWRRWRWRRSSPTPKLLDRAPSTARTRSR